MSKENKIENLEGEYWIPIKGFEGKYEISNMARVKRLGYTNIQKNRVGKFISVELKDIIISNNENYNSKKFPYLI
jgi:hypothetical protein